MIKNVDLAVEVSLAVLTHRPTHAEIICIKRISLYFRFSGMCLSWSEKRHLVTNSHSRKVTKVHLLIQSGFKMAKNVVPCRKRVNDYAFTADAITVPFDQNSFDECLHSLP